MRGKALALASLVLIAGCTRRKCVQKETTVVPEKRETVCYEHWVIPGMTCKEKIIPSWSYQQCVRWEAVQ